MRRANLLPLLSTLLACSVGPQSLGEGDGTGTGTETEGDGDGDGDDGAPMPDLPAEPLESCWTGARTSFAQLETMHVGIAGVVAVSPDGLWIEGEDGVHLDPALQGELAPAVATHMIGEPDDLWIAGTALRHWDGSTLENHSDGQTGILLAQNSAGQLWRAGKRIQDNTLAVARFDGGSWIEHTAPDSLAIAAFHVGEDSRFIISHSVGDGPQLARQTGAEPWIVEDTPLPPGVGYELSSDLDDAGALWLVAHDDCDVPLPLAHRDPGGTWHQAELDLGPGEYGLCNVEIHQIDGVAYIHRRGIDELWRWDGGTPPELVGSLPSGIIDVDSNDSRFVAMANGPVFWEITIEPEFGAELIDAYESFDAGPGAASSLDAVFSGSPDALQRFDGDSWTQLETLGPSLYSGFVDLWSASTTEVWAIEGHFTLDESRVWHWADGALTTWDMPELFDIWGREDEVWVIGSQMLGTGSVLRFSGTDWVQELELPDSVPLSLTGDENRLYVLDNAGRVHVRQGGDWALLGDALADGVTWGTAALAGEELLVEHEQEVFRDGPFDPPIIVSQLSSWDGSSWVDAASRWPESPEPPIAALVEDHGGGVWAMVDQGEVEPQLWYFDGQAWTQIEAPQATTQARLIAAPEGLLVHEPRYLGQHTRVFRWACN